MDFNPRMSVARSSANSQSRSRQPHDESDAFMTLPDKEIAGCISDIGISFTVADLQKPNPQQIQKVFEWFAEILMNTTREVVAPAMRAAAEELAGGQADIIFTADTRDLMGFFVTCQRLLRECGINDFTFSDLYKPTYPRLVKIFSYIINFIRFRESQTSIIDEHFNRSEQTKTRIEKLYAENQTLEDRVSELARSKPALDKTLRDKETRNEELKARLIELKRGQQSVLEKLERLKDEQRRLKAVLEERTTAELTVKQEVAKLRPYTQQSPAALETQLRELSSSLGADKAQIEALDRRARALQTSSDTFGVVGADVAACTKLLGDLQNDLAKEEEELAKAARHRDALSERSNNVRDVERQERLLQKQLGNVNARTEKLRRNAEEKAEAARVRMEELRAVHEKLGRERSEKGREMERRRVRIEQTEKKMADLKENIENEVHSAHAEYLKMESHIKLYITEMEQSI
ncbi:kinetochore-associated Ndc80 complex subunit nuf2 [Coniosporium apollinis]|uniref:Kinetochore-associated Ndc80 complex subunit nuf2 n=2 Tax=Coniosporium TaxID=2810619 RepID=A0ACC2Z9X3_9PEZI|nr:kinetochore-associated Ndc80 complex subunit nuf2 [Cladosporium sp. JES 115]KAJ9669398.1 kinetochore-associated Ndc80 complex subunit nuf2 [Coniosporium apollinis]